MRSVLFVALLLPMAGCLGSNDGGATAKDAFTLSQKAVDGTFEYSLFLGVTGTEGPLDWDAYEEDQRAQGGQAKRLVDTFDQDVPNGKFGDGILGAWMTTHFAYDEDRRLVGGLFTQIAADGDRRALFAPFTGPYSGTTAYASVEHRAMLQHANLVASVQDGPVLCALKTTTEDWHISSKEAAAAALATQAMQEHLAKYPEGELTYYYFPGLGVENGCEADIEVPSNYWTIFHTDLDQYLDSDQPLPTVAKVRLDADSGALLSATVEPLLLRPPTLIDHVKTYVDPVVPGGHHNHAVTFEVQEGASILELQAYRKTHPEGTVGEQTILRDPEGRPWQATSFEQALHQYVVDAPIAGTWAIEYDYVSWYPQGQHIIEYHGAVVYP